IPIPRLVDWVDQAVLYLHLGLGETGAPKTADAIRERLRLYGIRTATDLEATYAAAQARKDDLEPLLQGLGPGFDGRSSAATSLPRIRIILDAMADDEWLEYV